MTRKLATLILTAALLGGCSAEAAPPAPEQSAEDPRATLGLTIDAVMRGNYTFGLARNRFLTQADLALPGSADGQEFSVESGGGNMFGYRYVGDERFVRMPIGAGLRDLGNEYGQLLDEGGAEARTAESMYALLQAFDSRRWIPLGARAGEGDRFDIYHRPDGPGVAAVLGTVKTAERRGNDITGVLDLTAQPPAATLPWSGKDVVEMGDRAAAVPYTATLGRDGLLTRLVVQEPAHGEVKAGSWVMSLSKWGAVKPPELPAGKEVVQLPWK